MLPACRIYQDELFRLILIVGVPYNIQTYILYDAEIFIIASEAAQRVITRALETDAAVLSRDVMVQDGWVFLFNGRQNKIPLYSLISTLHAILEDIISSVWLSIVDKQYVLVISDGFSIMYMTLGEYSTILNITQLFINLLRGISSIVNNEYTDGAIVDMSLYNDYVYITAVNRGPRLFHILEVLKMIECMYNVITATSLL